MLRLTEADYAARQTGKTTKQATPLQRFQALGRMPKCKMNKTETEYAKRLEQMKMEGRIYDWRFHPMNIRLADRTFYEVDFLVIGENYRLEIHETKGGYVTDKGGMKIKLVAEALPWFRMVKCTKLKVKQGGGWKIEDY